MVNLANNVTLVNLIVFNAILLSNPVKNVLVAIIYKEQRTIDFVVKKFVKVIYVFVSKANVFNVKKIQVIT